MWWIWLLVLMVLVIERGVLACLCWLVADVFYKEDLFYWRLFCRVDGWRVILRFYTILLYPLTWVNVSKWWRRFFILLTWRLSYIWMLIFFIVQWQLFVTGDLIHSIIIGQQMIFTSYDMFDLSIRCLCLADFWVVHGIHSVCDEHFLFSLSFFNLWEIDFKFYLV